MFRDYLKRPNLVNEATLAEAVFRDIAKHYGIDPKITPIVYWPPEMLAAKHELDCKTKKLFGKRC